MSYVHVRCFYAERFGCISEYQMVGVFEVVLEMVKFKLSAIVATR